MKSLYQMLAAKRDGKELQTEEIEFLVKGYSAGKIADYQIAAFLMAAFVNGLSNSETSALTQSMLNSGARVKVSGLDRPLIDKHSTGGVGDKLSLTIAPVLANCGIVVGMFSGRSLGHTGGTLDKLESIPGMRVFHATATFGRLLRKHHFAISGQTDKIAPADRKIYALRDATGTVESIPLIVASIMSKKLALKSDGILFDVKTGSGAFMKSRSDSFSLASALLEVASANSLPATALITNMNQPIGRMVGNFLEIIETIEVLKGGGPDGTVRLTVELGAEMLLLAGSESDIATGRIRVRRGLQSGAGYENFCRYVADCGGDLSAIEAPGRLLKKAHKTIVKAAESGYICSVDTAGLGYLSGVLGAGRRSISDRIDPLAGMEVVARIGQKVSAGDLLAVLYASDRKKLAEVAEDAVKAFQLSEEKPPQERLILRRMTGGNG